MRISSLGSLQHAKQLHTYLKNEYKFHTQSWTKRIKRINGDVFIKGVIEESENYFYSIVKHITIIDTLRIN